MATSFVRTKHWTRVEYERLIDLGAFRPVDIEQLRRAYESRPGP